MKSQAHKDICWRCGGLRDDDDLLVMITRLDPHTRVLRPVTDEEVADMPDDFKEAHNFGYRASSICIDCAKEQGVV